MRTIKRTFDIIISFICLILFSWLFLMLYLLCKAKLGSPVFFRQNRPGLNGKIFTMYKFRTMTDARDTVLPESHKSAFPCDNRRLSVPTCIS